MQTVTRTNRRKAVLSAMPWILLAGWAVAGAVWGQKGRQAYVAASQVVVSELRVPACGAATRRLRRLAVATAYLPREEALRVARIRIADGGSTWSVERDAGLCRVTDPGGQASDEPCMLESCTDGYCAVRVPYVPVAGDAPSPVLEFSAADGTVLGSGRAAGGPEPVGSPPRLDVARSGRSLAVTAPDMPDGAARVTVTRGGKAVADSPLNLDARGRAGLTVPDGFDGVLVSVSEEGRDGRGVLQATAHVLGPFGAACPPAAP